MKFLLCFVVSITLSPVLGGNLLIVHFSNIGSYVRIMDGILQTLAPHHNITLYSIVHDNLPYPNVSLVKVKEPPCNSYFKSGLFETLCSRGGIHHVSYNGVAFLDKAFMEGIFSDPNVQRLLTTTDKYDALITYAALSEFIWQLAHVLQIPLIQISPANTFLHMNNAIGSPVFLSTLHNLFDSTPGFTFLERVTNYVSNLVAYIRYTNFYLPYIEKITNKYYPISTPSIATIYRNTSLLIINMNLALGHARPLMPNIVSIGGIHCRPARSLTTDLEEFIQGSGEHGIVYLSFGTSIKSKYPEHVKNGIIRVITKLKQRVLWKWNEDIEDLPSNVKVSKWFSQQDILGHNKTRLFITQAGQFSMLESAYHGVPVLAIPIAFDQPMNSRIAHDMGYCEYIPFCNFSEEKFYQLIQKIIYEPKYKHNVQKVSQLMKDVPMNASEKLIWWVDYILRHNGNPLVASLKDRSYGLQRMDVDIVSFLYISVTILLLILVYLVKKIKQFCQALNTSVIMKKKIQ